MLLAAPQADAGRLGCITTSPKQQQIFHFVPSQQSCPPPPHKGRRPSTSNLRLQGLQASAGHLQGDWTMEEQGPRHAMTVTDCMKEPLHAVLCTNVNSLCPLPGHGPGDSPVPSIKAGHSPYTRSQLLQGASTHCYSIWHRRPACSLGFTSNKVPLPQMQKRHHRHRENYNSQGKQPP